MLLLVVLDVVSVNGDVVVAVVHVVVVVVVVIDVVLVAVTVVAVVIVVRFIHLLPFSYDGSSFPEARVFVFSLLFFRFLLSFLCF